MRERAARHHGTLVAGHQPNGGFVVHARVPYQAPTRMTDAPVRVLIVDDQALLLGSLRVLVETEPDLVVGEAGNGSEAVDLVQACSPDVVLMDVRMPDMDGIEATSRITAREHAPSILVLTTFDLDEYVYSALLAEASGFHLHLSRATVKTHIGRLLDKLDARDAPSRRSPVC